LYVLQVSGSYEQVITDENEDFTFTDSALLDASESPRFPSKM
jgi:hypothetical protein